MKTSANPQTLEGKMRILFVPGFVADTYSEIERSFVELCSTSDLELEFLWLVPDISCKLNSFARPESRNTLKEPVCVPYLRKNNIPYVTGNISRYNLFSNFLLFREIFRINGIDAIYTQFGIERFWATFYGKLWGKVTIWNEHWHSLGRRHTLFKRFFYRLFVDHFIAVSKFIANTLPPYSRVHTIPNAIQAEPHVKLTPREILELRNQFGLTDGTKMVLMVAAFRPEKRHMLALKVCEQILKNRKDIVFIFLGNGSVRELFLAKVRDLGLDRHIIAPGHVHNVDDYYSIASVCILSSHYEPFGYVVLEAMRHALPVVAFDTGGPAEVIRNGETGFLVKDADIAEFTQKLLELIDSEPLRAAIGERARQAVRQEYNREAWIRQVNTTLKNIVTGHRAQSLKSA